MNEFVGIMAAPVVAALVLVVMHGYLGGHVVRRGVIFVDIALAQVAASGVAVALYFGAEVGTDAAWFAGLGATFVGAVQIAGVLLVFTLLVVPTVMAYRRGRIGGVQQLIFVVLVVLLAVIVGAAASYILDVPTSATIVCVFGILLGVQVAAEALISARRPA